MKIKISVFLFMISLSSLAQTGPAGVGMNDGSSALKLWLDAEKGSYVDTSQLQLARPGDRVMFWKDLSGSNNNVFAGPDSSTRPTFTGENPLLNSNSGLRFTKNGGNKNKRNILSSKTFSKTNDITIYCVFHAMTKAAGNNTTPFKANNYHPNMWYSGCGLVDAGDSMLVNDISMSFCDTSLAAGAGDSTNKMDYCVKTPALINKTLFGRLEKEAWNGKLRISLNGETSTEYQAGAQPINNSPRYFIGSNSNISSNSDIPFFDGYIANVLVYNRILSMAEKVILENYLSAKYGIPLKKNDLYTFDDSQNNFDAELIGVGKASDGSFQQTAKGEGLIEISMSGEMDKDAYIFIAHNGKSLSLLPNNNPEGVETRLERLWVCSKINNTQKVDLFIDSSIIPSVKKEELVLLIDQNNDGLFSNEVIGEGIIPVSEVTSHGRFAFKGINFKHGSKFTFAKLEAICSTGCETFFTPNGDGLSDVYYLDQSGQTSIIDRSGKVIKSLPTPAYWDGTNDKGELAIPGIYFLISNEDMQKTVTLIR